MSGIELEAAIRWLEQMTFERGQSTRPIPYGYLSPVIDAARRDAARQSAPVTMEEVAEALHALIWDDEGPDAKSAEGLVDSLMSRFVITRKPTETEE